MFMVTGRSKRAFFPACVSARFDQPSASATLVLCVCLLFQSALAAKCFSRQTYLSLRGLFQTTFQSLSSFSLFFSLVDNPPHILTTCEKVILRDFKSRMR